MLNLFQRQRGLISKVWLPEIETEYASFYLWETKKAIENFMNSPMVVWLAKIPFLKDSAIVEYPVVEASRITQGIQMHSIGMVQISSSSCYS